MARAPSREQGADHVARLVASRLGVEIDIQHRPDHREPVSETGRLADRAPLPAREGDDHDPPPVGGGEVAPETAVEIVADRRARRVVDLDIGDVAEIADHREHHV
jgi:hypothetical protein